MAEKEQGHRHGWENRTLYFDFIYSTAGLVLGSAVAAGLVAGAYFSAASGHDAVGAGFLATSAVGMVPAFVRGRDLFKKTKSSTSEPETQPSAAKKISPPQAKKPKRR